MSNSYKEYLEYLHHVDNNILNDLKNKEEQIQKLINEKDLYIQKIEFLEKLNKKQSNEIRKLRNSICINKEDVKEGSENEIEEKTSEDNGPLVVAIIIIIFVGFSFLFIAAIYY